ncbi:quinon protein alcohol dehydrogenase-like superfamily [Aspergillus cavernicola]|uniref:Quinon protein alcohol dehydrogenase-like superfamily n=1 Tax=Aspergillus cavernicola TaxID=176166 RepID=A0ABR4IJR8_9EURO
MFRRLKATLKGQPSTKNPNAEGRKSHSGDATPRPISASEQRLGDPSSIEDLDGRDRWQTAYGELTQDERVILSREDSRAGVHSREESCRPQIREVLDDVIRETKGRYGEYLKGDTFTQQPGNGIDIRATAQKILKSVLSCQDVINKITTFDPTGHAASAWGIVSLGLTMAQNHIDRRDALFESAGFLADILARCAFIEGNFYHAQVEQLAKEAAIVLVYKAILRFVAEVRSSQQLGKGKSLLENITAITDHPLTALKDCITKEESQLKQWIILDEQLRRKEEAENILAQIDIMRTAIQDSASEAVLSRLPGAQGAFYDSFADQHEDKCLDGTREEILATVKDWGRSQDKCIFWLSGMAGTGKSTIARTVARDFKTKGILGATFFFKRGETDRGSALKLFPTVVRQLVVQIPQLIPGIQRAMKSDPTLGERSLREQFNKLLLQPLLDIKQQQVTTTAVIIIDALDECENGKDVKTILSLLPQVRKSTSVHLQVFLTSRPDLHNSMGFHQIDRADYQGIVLQEENEKQTKDDIKLFLEAKFSKIRTERALSLTWPGEEKVDRITELASPLFIAAATIYLFVADQNWNPEGQLDKYLEGPALTRASRMDWTYRPILDQALIAADEDTTELLLEEFQKIIGAIVLLATPLSVSALADLLKVPAEDIENRLEGFRSVLDVPPGRSQPVRSLHSSFRDYLLEKWTKGDRSRSRFWVNEKEKHELLTAHCFAVMGTSLRKDICRLCDYSTARADIGRNAIAQYLPPSLEYSCRYWAYHLTRSESPYDVLEKSIDTLKTHFLHWLEAMSILGRISEAVNIVNMLHSLAESKTDCIMLGFISDAKRFVQRNAPMADVVPLQLYCSGLLFAPQTSVIKGMFTNDIPGWIYKPPNVQQHWSPELFTTKGHAHQITSLEFSPAGNLIASASYDRTVRLWDMTGALQHTLDGHKGAVYTAVFSPDGKMIASCSDDCTVRLWDVTGGSLHTLKGHEGGVISAVFSPDGNVLASCSHDHTVKLWSIAGVLQHTLGGHSSSVRMVVFSPSGELLVSASDDNTLKLWNVLGVLQHILTGHGNPVSCVAFSPDSRTIVSSSLDRTVKLWDTSGVLQHTIESPTGSVHCVKFSPDGTLLATASSDGTIKLWHTVDWTLHHVLYDNSDGVTSIDFSFDSKQLVSGSRYATAVLWNVASGEFVNVIRGGPTRVGTVKFSPNGSLIASGSLDQSIRLWDVPLLNVQGTLTDYSQVVTNLKFSPDGQLASAAVGRSIRVWDAATVQIQHTLGPHSGEIDSIKWSANSQLILSHAGSFESSRLWDAATGTLRYLPPQQAGRTEFKHAEFSPDSKLVAYFLPEAVKVVDTATGALLYTVEDTTCTCPRISFSPEGTLIAAYFLATPPEKSLSEDEINPPSDRTIKLLHASTGAVKHTLEGHSDPTRAVALSPNGELVASGSTGGTIKVWHVTGTLKHLLHGHSDPVNALAFSPDSKTLISSSEDRTVRTWNISSATLHHTVSTPGIVHNSLAFSPCGMYIHADSELLGASELIKEGQWEYYHDIASVEPEWVLVNGKRALWIPHEYRHPSAVWDTRVLLGSATEKVLFMEFATDL